MLMGSLVIVVIQSGDVIKIGKQLNCSSLISKDTTEAKFGGTVKSLSEQYADRRGTEEEEEEERG